jgi:ATP-dependent DNA ligase
MNLTNFKPQLVGTGEADYFIFKNEVAVIEPKIDGIRVIVEKRSKEIKLYSRNMRDWTKKFKPIINKLLEGIKYEYCILDGEMAVIKNKKFTSSNFIMKNNLAENEKYVYFAFDIIEIGNDNMMVNDIVTRKWHLSFGIKPNENLSLVPYTIINNTEDYENIYRKILDKGGEGIVLKNFNPYMQGRSYNWLKKKPFETLDLTIISKKEKKDKKGWIYGLSDNEIKVGSTCSNINLELGQVVEIKFEKKYEKTKGYSLRFPKIFRVRGDKIEKVI